MTNNSYSIALFEIAKEDSALTLCKDSFQAFMDNYDGDLKSFFTSPRIDLKAKKEVISKAFEHTYENFVYFIYVIIDNHREDFIEEIYAGFMDSYNREMRIKIVKVISKDNLTDTEYNRLFSALTSHLSGYQIIVENEIDDTIISGYKIYADGSSIDFSINKLIANYKSQF